MMHICTDTCLLDQKHSVSKLSRKSSYNFIIETFHHIQALEISQHNLVYVNV